MATLSNALTSPMFDRLQFSNRPLITKLCLMLSDSAALLISVSLGILAKAVSEGGVQPASYLRLWPFLGVFLLAYAASGLYSIVALSPARERSRATASSALLFLLLGAATVSFRGAQRHFTWTLFLAIAISVFLLPAMRTWTRRCFAGQDWWGFPAVIFGAGAGGRRILDALRSDPNMALKALAFVDENAGCEQVAGVPVFRNYDDVKNLLPSGAQAYAVIVNQDLPDQDRDELVDRYRSYFSHILVVPEMNDILDLRVDSKNVAGMLGLEIRA